MLPMDLDISSPNPRLSPSGDPEKEISDDDDDDRNHKHRRREAHSQSLEGDASEQVLTQPYRKRNKPFENGHPYREGGSQYSETWKNHNMINQEREAGRFEKRRQHVASYPRTPLDLSQRVSFNQSLSADPSGLARGRGREPGSWGQRESWFSRLDIGSQLVQPGSVPPSLFSGRGLPNVPNASWSVFGLIPAIPNGGLDTVHTIGMQGALKPSINPALSLGIPRPRCRDFEERGFCLRGDMCPMEHGVNRIVVEDVQSLSQFNLPVSLPSAHILGTPAGQGAPPTNAPFGTLMNNKSLQNKSSKPGTSDDGLGVNGAFFGGSVTGASDFYDPDQPLWSDSHETSPALLNLNSSNMDRIEPLLDTDQSERLPVGQYDGSDSDRPMSRVGAAATSQGTSVRGRIGSSKNNSDLREKIDLNLNSSNVLDNERRNDLESISGTADIAEKGRMLSADEIGAQVKGLSSKPLNDSGQKSRKSSQKALRTLFVSCIPQKQNKREALLLHFKKFGEVIDIYIPSNGEQAFVQFSKREEAEAALKAPDAVMGNRFIKLWWANRDSIPDDGLTGVNLQANSGGLAPAAGPTYTLDTSKGKDNVQISWSKSNVTHSTPILPSLDHQKPGGTNGTQSAPPLKKLDSLELLKEELRKKQEMLDQRRSEFKRQLNKLEKQASGLKDDVPSDQSSKRPKGGTLVDVAKIELSRPSSGPIVSSAQAEETTDSGSSVETVVVHGLKSGSTIAVSEPSTLKPSFRPLASIGAHFATNRFKLDNRPTAFKILPPLPACLAHVSVLKDHFSTYGDLSLVELEDFEPQESQNEAETTKISARISFATRCSAERAFFSGKCWEGENMQFTWLPASNSNKDIGRKENSSAPMKLSSDVNVQSGGEVATELPATAGDGELEGERRSDDGKDEDQVAGLETSRNLGAVRKSSP